MASQSVDEHLSLYFYNSVHYLWEMEWYRDDKNQDTNIGIIKKKKKYLCVCVC